MGHHAEDEPVHRRDGRADHLHQEHQGEHAGQQPHTAALEPFHEPRLLSQQHVVHDELPEQRVQQLHRLGQQQAQQAGGELPPVRAEIAYNAREGLH